MQFLAPVSLVAPTVKPDLQTCGLISCEGRLQFPFSWACDVPQSVLPSGDWPGSNLVTHFSCSEIPNDSVYDPVALRPSSSFEFQI